MNSNKQTARTMGILFLVQMATAIAGNTFIISLTSPPDFLKNIFASQQKLAAAGILMFMCFISVIAIGVLMYPVLKKYNHPVALSYIATRLVETIVQIFGIICILSLIPLSQDLVIAEQSEKLIILTLGKTAIQTHWYSYHSGMIFLGFGSLFFCYVLYHYSLVPKLLSALGFVGYFILAVTSLLSIVGIEPGLYVAIPVFLFEVIIGGWLIVKGFGAAL